MGIGQFSDDSDPSHLSLGPTRSGSSLTLLLLAMGRPVTWIMDDVTLTLDSYT